MPITYFVDVNEMSPEIKLELSKLAIIKRELPSINTYILEFAPEGRTYDEINQSRENFIKTLKNYQFVRNVNRSRLVSPCCDG
jgi:hypothetical protein